MKDAYYFSHDANAQNDPNIVKLLFKHGWSGYGLYWAIIEKLRNEPEYIMDTDYDMIAYALRTNSDLIESIIGDFNLFVIEKECFHSPSLKRRMGRLDEIKEKRVYAGKMSGISRNKAKPKQSLNKKGTGVEQVLNSIVKHSTEQHSTAKNSKNIHSGFAFDKFWKIYDLKINKPDCEEIWNGKNKKGIEFTDTIRGRIFEHLSIYIPNTNIDGSYPSRKNPKTYLNNNGWDDDVVIPRKEEGIIQWN